MMKRRQGPETDYSVKEWQMAMKGNKCYLAGQAGLFISGIRELE